VARVEILRLRFEDDMPIRDIAERRNVDAARLHHDYAQARAEFQTALRDVVRAHEGGSPGDVERECARLLDMFR
jgi:RNA polymerase sigma-70 factor (ECF subfamily)